MSLHPTGPELDTRPLRRSEYERLIDLGCFDQERVELLYGVIVRMSPQNSPHSFAVEQLNMLLVPLALAGRARVRIQSPMAASDVSEPEPDALVSPLEDSPGEHPASALLVVEVADSSLRLDRGIKARLYAETGAREYWVVDVQGRAVEVFTAAHEGKFTARERVPETGVLRPLAFPDLEVPVGRLFR
jgi:Uma2 family endonuclease